MKELSGESKKTTDHEEIKKWVEERGGKPAVVKDTENMGEGIGVLRIDFEGDGKDSSLEEISWEDFFRTFDEKNLAFLYQDETAEGKESRFFKLVKNE